MAKNSKRSKKIRKLVVVCFLIAVMFATATYAWFIGMKTVNVSSFDVKIATTEGLWLSMDGQSWTYTLDAKNATAYTGNTNTWAEDGLIPMSSVGDMDATASRMILFEKGSLTTTKGGYRLLATRVHNFIETSNPTALESDGYVAFDLFIKNDSGVAYYAENNELNEEAIYLTTNSQVKVADVGGEAGTGIENSVRVAFTQIGRVIGTTSSDDVDTITGITCSDSSESGHAAVTGICRDAQIWEPNDKEHVQNAINWYDTACRARKSTGTNVTLAASYDTDTHCGAVTTSETLPTYAISRTINVDDNVDVYDGLRYNTYESNTASYETYKAALDGASNLETTKQTYKLVEYPYFTDSMKVLEGTDRPTFMTLAPNSITKLRVYIYIEGQDVDNYDFASLGKKITINFGFTKERFIESDVDYQGPAIPATNPTDNPTD